MAPLRLRLVLPYDERLGKLLRLIRRRASLTQEELAKAAGVPVKDVAVIEAGGVGGVRVDRVRRAFAAAGGQARMTPWWNGAAADRLLDQTHARLVERAVSVFVHRGWQTAVEVSFSEYGERGSIDILALMQSRAAIAVGEVKSAFGSLEETNRALDVKERHAPKIALARFGCRAAIVGRLLILPDDRTVRRVVATHDQTMTSVYPARSREVRAWIRAPNRPLRGIWFLSDPPIAEEIRRQEAQIRTNPRGSAEESEDKATRPKRPA